MVLTDGYNQTGGVCLERVTPTFDDKLTVIRIESEGGISKYLNGEITQN